MAKKRQKALIIVRHAHRDKPFGRAFDNGLSTKGRKQASKIARHYRKYFEVVEPKLFSSPKIRCVETLLPLARALKLEVTPALLLEEQDEANGESMSAMMRRVRHFCRDWEESKDPVWIACSHGDWIPLCLKELTGADIELKKGAWAQIDSEGEPRLTWLLQKLP